jgi:tetratricopeptide (TPR) repeat protein
MIAVFAIAAVLSAQAPDLVVKVEKQANAQAQLDYGRKLARRLASARTPEEKHIAVANAAANLMAVERGWPNQRAAIVEANALLVALYFAGGMPRNAIEAAQRGLVRAPRDHRLHVAAGRAHAQLGDKAAAIAAFRKAIETFEPAAREMMESLAGMNAAAFFMEREKEHGASAAALRHAAALPGLTPTVRVTLRVRALEQAALAGDRAAMANDLARLRDAHRAALATSLTPEQRRLLEVAERAIARFER